MDSTDEAQWKIECILDEKRPITDTCNHDALVKVSELEKNRPVDELDFELVPEIRRQDVNHGNEEAQAIIRDLAAAGNFNAKVLLATANACTLIEEDARSIDSRNDGRFEEQAVTFETEVLSLFFHYLNLSVNYSII